MMFLGKERRQRPAVHLQGHSCTKPLHPLGLPPTHPVGFLCMQTSAIKL